MLATAAARRPELRDQGRCRRRRRARRPAHRVAELELATDPPVSGPTTHPLRRSRSARRRVRVPVRRRQPRGCRHGSARPPVEARHRGDASSWRPAPAAAPTAASQRNPQYRLRCEQRAGASSRRSSSRHGPGSSSPRPAGHRPARRARRCRGAAPAPTRTGPRTPRRRSRWLGDPARRRRLSRASRSGDGGTRGRSVRAEKASSSPRRSTAPAHLPGRAASAAGHVGCGVEIAVEEVDRPLGMCRPPAPGRRRQRHQLRHEQRQARPPRGPVVTDRAPGGAGAPATARRRQPRRRRADMSSQPAGGHRCPAGVLGHRGRRQPRHHLAAAPVGVGQIEQAEQTSPGRGRSRPSDDGPVGGDAGHRQMLSDDAGEVGTWWVEDRLSVSATPASTAAITARTAARPSSSGSAAGAHLGERCVPARRRPAGRTVTGVGPRRRDAASTRRASTRRAAGRTRPRVQRRRVRPTRRPSSRPRRVAAAVVDIDGVGEPAGVETSPVLDRSRRASVAHRGPARRARASTVSAVAATHLPHGVVRGGGTAGDDPPSSASHPLPRRRRPGGGRPRSTAAERPALAAPGQAGDDPSSRTSRSTRDHGRSRSPLGAGEPPRARLGGRAAWADGATTVTRPDVVRVLGRSAVGARRRRAASRCSSSSLPGRAGHPADATTEGVPGVPAAPRAATRWRRCRAASRPPRGATRCS